MRSGCSRVSLPCAKPIDAACSSITESGSTPCHQKWLGSRLMPTFSPTSARSRRKLSLPKTVTPGCSSRQMRTPGAAYSAQAERSLPVGDDVLAELPLPQRLVVAADPGDGEDARAAARPSRPPGQPLIVTTVSTPSSVASSIAPRNASCASLRAAGRGVEGVARRVHARERRPVLAQLALQPIALAAVGEQRARGRGEAAATMSRRPSRGRGRRVRRTTRWPRVASSCASPSMKSPTRMRPLSAGFLERSNQAAIERAPCRRCQVSSANPRGAPAGRRRSAARRRRARPRRRDDRTPGRGRRRRRRAARCGTPPRRRCDASSTAARSRPSERCSTRRVGRWRR